MVKSAKAFISYSHADEHALERLEKHLAVLLREKTLVQWVDQKILAGGEINAEISKNLEACDLFIALVSPDFLASNYCYEREMTRAIERHDAGRLRLVPIIVQPCDWKSSPLQRFKALPKDGKPVSDWTNENNAWLNVVTQLRRLIEDADAPPADHGSPQPAGRSEKAQKYRVKRDFDEVDKMEYREQAFAATREYFQNATAEVAGIEGIKSRFVKLGDDGFTCTVVNRARQRGGTAHITVYCKSGRHGFGDIYYSFEERAERNSANGWLTIETDDYDLFLKHGGMITESSDAKLSPRAAAEQLWEEFLNHAGIDNAK
jgi:TIR domain